MAVPFMKIYHTDSTGVTEDITDCVDMQDKRGLQMKDSKATFRINASRYRNRIGAESSFNEDDDISIYVDMSPITLASSQLLIAGQVQEISHTFGEGGASTSVTIADRTTLLLSSIWGKVYQDTPIDQIITSVISNAPGVSGRVTTNNVASSTTTGSAFPSVDMAKSMKPIYEWITDLSQPTITGEDRAYLFFVDKDNDLHWFYPSQTLDSSIIEGEDEIYDISLKKSQDEIVNMIIYNAGQDLEGNGCLWYYYDPTSKSNKLRMKFQPMTDIGRDLFENEIRNGVLTESSGGPFHYQGKDYDVAGSYPLTPSWTGATSVSDDSAYNDAFRTRQKEMAAERSSGITRATAGLRWNGTVTVKGTHSYVAGDNVSFTSPTIGLQSQPLRVWDVAHQYGQNGWVTTVSLREDDSAVA